MDHKTRVCQEIDNVRQSQICLGYKEGTSLKKLAKVHGVTIQTVRIILIEHGVKIRSNRTTPEYIPTLEEIKEAKVRIRKANDRGDPTRDTVPFELPTYICDRRMGGSPFVV